MGKTTAGLTGGVNNEGLKFELVAADDKDKADYYSWFSVSYPLTEGKTFGDVVIEVYNNKAGAPGNNQGRLMVIGIADSYYLSVSKDATCKSFAYTKIGGTELVNLTEEFVAAPTYYSIVKVDEDGKALKALGVAFDDESQWLDMNAVQLDQPEGQWYATSETDKTKLVLANREKPERNKDLRFSLQDRQDYRFACRFHDL